MSCLKVTPAPYALPPSFFSSFTAAEVVEAILGRATLEDATDITR